MSSNEGFVAENQDSPAALSTRETLSRLRARISARANAKHCARTSAYKFLASLRARKRLEAREAGQALSDEDAGSESTVSDTPTGTERS
ncbi:MAG: hypothetical protein K6E40_12050 [Desulfovibrio sp.]|nr:hypothetical protein [Desulfovibrio sp.]